MTQSENCTSFIKCNIILGHRQLWVTKVPLYSWP